MKKSLIALAALAATGAFGMKSAQAAPLGRGDGVLYKTAFIERVGMNGHLHIGFFSHVQAVADGAGCGAPVFV